MHFFGNFWYTVAMDVKSIASCPTRCSVPSVSTWQQTLTPERQAKIDAIRGESKRLLYCGHCNTLWVEYVLDQSDYIAGTVWYQLLRVEDMQTMSDKWLI